MKIRELFNRKTILYVLLDVFLINAAAFFALFVRFEFSFSFMQNGYWDVIRAVWAPGTLVCIVSFACFHVYSSMWRFASFKELMETGVASVIGSAFYMMVVFVMKKTLPRSFFFFFALVLFIFVCASRYIIQWCIERKRSRKFGGTPQKRTMVIGAGGGAAMAIKELNTSEYSHNKVVCAIDDDVSKHGRLVRGVRVVGGRECIPDAVRKYSVEEIIFCIPSAAVQEKNKILEICNGTGAKLKIMPSLSQLANGDVLINQIKDVSIEDLLGRAPVHADNSIISGRVFGKTVLVTGGGGSIGSKLCRQIAALKPGKLIIFDIYENNAYDIQQELIRKYPELDLEVLIGSVREERRINDLFAKYHPDVVCHAAAHKHVPLMEDSPAEAIKNNVFGTYNVAKAAGEYGTKLFILISTDKAVNPTNVMGASKRLCEMVVQSMNSVYRTEYIAVRFGNVMGSNGSVIPLFKKQIAAGGPVTVTDKRVTRFFMTIPEAVTLILQAGAFAEGGEVFILDMGKPVRIDNMARQLIRLSGLEPDVDIKIEYIGLRPGEKLYEELLLKGEGLQKTSNNLIYIGHQKMYSPEEIQEKLASLREILYSPKEDVRERIMSLIQEDADPNYRVVKPEEYAAV
ncbi:MAG: polysaccharide biosynthesis protein [Oscillospiraceae bacterium]